MKKIILILLFIFSYGADLDFDGVPDKKDYCPRTPLLAVVNKHGCQINKILPFNLNSEIGYQYSIDYKIPLIYIKNAIFFETYSFDLYLSRIHFKNKFKSYNNNIAFSKNFYTKNSYFKFSLYFYLDTYFQKNTYALKFTDYLINHEILFFYKYKRHTRLKRDTHILFLEKVIKYPKVIVLPFAYVENSIYKTDSYTYKKYIGLSLIFKLKQIYVKSSFLSNYKLENKVISLSIGKNF